METLNVMVQAQVTSDYQCRRLCELMNSEETGFVCSLSPKQKGHHVTLSYKPSQEGLESIRKIFKGQDLFFSPTEVKWDSGICALFGHVITNPAKPKQLGGLYHITLGGTVPPVNSARLEHRWDGMDKVAGAFPLEYVEVPLGGTNKTP